MSTEPCVGHTHVVLPFKSMHQPSGLEVEGWESPPSLVPETKLGLLGLLHRSRNHILDLELGYKNEKVFDTQICLTYGPASIMC